MCVFLTVTKKCLRYSKWHSKSRRPHDNVDGGGAGPQTAVKCLWTVCRGRQNHLWAKSFRTLQWRKCASTSSLRTELSVDVSSREDAQLEVARLWGVNPINHHPTWVMYQTGPLTRVTANHRSLSTTSEVSISWTCFCGTDLALLSSFFFFLMMMSDWMKNLHFTHQQVSPSGILISLSQILSSV